MNPVDTSSLRPRRDAIVNAHIEAEAVRHDVAGVIATFKHPRYEVPSLGAVSDGHAEVDGLVSSLLGGFPDFWLRQIRRHHADNAVIVECRRALLPGSRPQDEKWRWLPLWSSSLRVMGSFASVCTSTWQRSCDNWA